MSKQPFYTAALVGKPNVGKSSLFNALINKNYAIVHEEAGVTRDTLCALLTLSKRHKSTRTPTPPTPQDFILLLDTAGVTPSSPNLQIFHPTTDLPSSSTPTQHKQHFLSQPQLSTQIITQIATSVHQADILIALFDVHDLSGEDHAILALLRSLNKPLLTVFNKVDHNEDAMLFHAETHSLGIKNPFFISAKTHSHLLEIKEKLLEIVQTCQKKHILPQNNHHRPPWDHTISIIGKPNTGKSSLLNALHKKPTAIVHPTAGTTRDLIEACITLNLAEKTSAAPQKIAPPPPTTTTLRLIDTAGLRRRTRKKTTIEVFSVQKVIHAVNQCNLALLLIDATDLITEQDKKISTIVIHAHKPLIIAVNKWDLYQKTPLYKPPPHQSLWQAYKERLKFLFPLSTHLPIVKISVLQNLGLKALITHAHHLLSLNSKLLTTHQVNSLLKKATTHYPPPSTHHPNTRSRSLKIYYGLQLQAAPPVIKIFINHKSLFKDHYKQYLINFIRQAAFGPGIPLILIAIEKSAMAASHPPTASSTPQRTPQLKKML